MKFTINWLKEHLETKSSDEDIINKLTAIGLEVEEVKDAKATYGDFLIAQVINEEKHPNADKLKLCKVDVGGKVVDVVVGLLYVEPTLLDLLEIVTNSVGDGAQPTLFDLSSHVSTLCVLQHCVFFNSHDLRWWHEKGVFHQIHHVVLHGKHDDVDGVLARQRIEAEILHSIVETGLSTCIKQLSLGNKCIVRTREHVDIIGIGLYSLDIIHIFLQHVNKDELIHCSHMVQVILLQHCARV